MRGVLLALAMGGLAMLAQEAEAQEKEPKAPYKEFVTVKRWGEAGKKFQDPHKDVMAFRRLEKGEVITIFIRSADTAGGTPEPKTEIVDADGNVFVVTKVFGGPPEYACRVTKKP